MIDEAGQPQQQPAVLIMQSVTINPMPEFSPDAKIGTSLATRWSNWQSDFEMYLTASGITNPKRKPRRARKGPVLAKYASIKKIQSGGILFKMATGI